MELQSISTVHAVCSPEAESVLNARPTRSGRLIDRLRQGDVRQLREAGKILPMEQILERVRAEQPGQIVEVGLDREDGRYVYEVELIDDDDRVHELELDAASGDVLNRRQK